ARRPAAGPRWPKLAEFAKWSALLDNNTCDWCSWADLRIFDTNIEPYDPPMHHGCRCIIAYITADEYPPDETSWGAGAPPESWPPGRVRGQLPLEQVREGKSVVRTAQIRSESFVDVEDFARLKYGKGIDIIDIKETN